MKPWKNSAVWSPFVILSKISAEPHERIQLKLTDSSQRYMGQWVRPTTGLQSTWPSGNNVTIFFMSTPAENFLIHQKIPASCVLSLEPRERCDHNPWNWTLALLLQPSIFAVIFHIFGIFWNKPIKDIKKGKMFLWNVTHNVCIKAFYTLEFVHKFEIISFVFTWIRTRPSNFCQFNSDFLPTESPSRQDLVSLFCQ